MSAKNDQQLVRYSGPNQDGSGRSSPYPSSRLAGPISLIDAAAEIERAAESVSQQASAQLEIIARQIRHLQEQAQEVLEKAQEDLQLHQARCNFQRVPGRTYFLYKRTGGELFFSMLSPADHGGLPSHAFIGGYRLELNNTWTRAEKAEEADAEREALRGYLQAPG